MPKALVSVCGKPLLERTLAFLHANAMTRIGVNTHAFADQLIDFQMSSENKFTLFHEAGDIRGTGGAFNFAHEFLAAEDTFFVCNVDILANVNVCKAYETFLLSDAIAGLIAVPAQQGNGSIYMNIATNDYLGARSVYIRPNVHSADFIGMAFYRKEFLSLVTQEDFSIVPVWQRAQEQGYKVSVICTEPDSYWCDAGTPRDLAQIHFDVLDGRLTLDIPPENTCGYYCKKSISPYAARQYCVSIRTLYMVRNFACSIRCAGVALGNIQQCRISGFRNS